MFRSFLAACLLGLAVAGGSQAASVRPLVLDDLVDTAALAFQGTCVGNRVQREESTGFIVTYTTFAVKDALKGPVATTHVIKQIGGNLPEGGMAFRVDGVPAFTVGEDYVVFLAGVSTAGFSSPVGLGQGKFAIRPEAGGAKVGNGRDFREMTAGMPQVALPEAMAKALAGATPVRELGLAEFKQLVRARIGRSR